MLSQRQINEEIANGIRNLIIKYGFGEDGRIYFNGKAYSFTDNKVEILEDMYASDYIEYSNNNKTVVMSFEGTLYRIFNYYQEDKGFINELNNLLDKYRMYFEMGYAWSLCVYPID